MFHLWINEVVGFSQQNIWKQLWKSDILSKDAGRWTASLLKMSLFHRCFSSKMFEKHPWKSDILPVKTNYLVST